MAPELGNQGESNPEPPKISEWHENDMKLILDNILDIDTWNISEWGRNSHYIAAKNFKMS